ncbi:MAG: polysaccharide biosynthesis tyrosine autokinase, partial [Chloroflexota bacterium]
GPTIETWDETIDFRRLLTVVQRWAWLLALGLVIGAVAAFIFSRMQTPMYEATTNILVTRNSQQTVGDLTQSLSLTQLVETYVRMLSMDEFLGIVSERVNYEVIAENVSVSALANTQIIVLHVQDMDPARASLIADTMVLVLIERNEALQAGRYAEAEQSLDVQITEIEGQIAEVQEKLDQAKDNALVEQVAEAQTNIDATVEVINVTQAELARLEDMTWESAHFQLDEARTALAAAQGLLDRQIAERSQVETSLATDPLAQTDPIHAATLQARITELNTRIDETQRNIEQLQQEIEFLLPLETQAGFDKALVEKENLLKTQQALLTSYQNIYTNLLSTEEVKRTTNEIDNLEKNLALYQEVYLNLLSSREQVKTERLQNTPTVEQVSPASTGADPVKPRILINTLLGGLAGLILAVVLVVVRESADDTIKSREEVEKLLGTQVIGYVVEIADEQDDGGIYVARAPRSPVAEAFRSLRTNLEYSASEQPIRSILVTSSAPSEGKSTVAANLAAILSHAGKSVLLIDADLRRPRIHRYAGITSRTGLSDLLDPEQDEAASDHVRKLKIKNRPELYVLPSGAAADNPADMLGSSRMRKLLQELINCYDYVVIDAPPMVVADPQVLAGMVDAVLLVMIPGKTRTDAIHIVKEQMKRTGARLLGVVFNRLKHSQRAGYGGNAYYYPYYYSSNYYDSEDGKDSHTRRKKKRTSHRVARPEKSNTTEASAADGTDAENPT